MLVNKDNVEKAVQLLKTGQKKAQDFILELVRKTYLAIPEEQKIKKGITWVGRKLGHSFYENISNLRLPLLKLVRKLLFSKKKELKILGLFILSEYGKAHPKEVFSIFKKFAKDDDRQVRNGAAIAFKKVIEKNRKESFKFLQVQALSLNPNTRCFICEAIRPIAENYWLLDEPKKSIRILRLFMWDGHMSVKKALSKNLSELSKKNPLFIYDFLARQMHMGNLHTYWIAYRACKELVKDSRYRKRVLKLLKIDQYNYKGKTYH